MTTQRSQKWAFGKSVVFGSLAGAALPLAYILVLIFFTLQEVFASQKAIWQAVLLIAVPLMITFPIVFAASIIFGLPLTLLLKSINRESLGHYCLIGTSIGFVITIVGLWLLGSEAGYWIAILGGAAGGVTGYTWWTSARAPLQHPSDISSTLTEEGG